MAEGGFEMEDFDRSGGEATIDEEAEQETTLITSPNYASLIQKKENELASFSGRTLEEQRKELLKTKVDAFLKAVLEKYNLYPLSDFVYGEFELGDDGRSLYLKEGHRRVTQKNNTAQFLDLKSLGPADFIRNRLFPEYKTTTIPSRPPRTKKALANIKQAAQKATAESIELVDLPQRAADVDTEVKRLFSEDITTIPELPIRELLGLDTALQRQRGALVDNLAKLSQLDADITAAENEVDGENHLQRLRDERSTRLEAAAANREALRTQFSRIRETIERILNDDTSLAERLRILFREQGVTIVSILTALGFIVSTIVLAIQTALGGGGPTPAPTPGSEKTAADWVKKQLKALAGWLKALAGKAAAGLPGIIGAIVSWLLRTAGSVAVWLAEHLWALVVAIISAVVVYLRTR